MYLKDDSSLPVAPGDTVVEVDVEVGAEFPFLLHDILGNKAWLSGEGRSHLSSW